MCTVILQLLQGKCCCLRKKRHTITSSILKEHKDKAAADGPIEKPSIYSELLGILQRRASFVFVMEHVDEGNCHVITPC